MEERAEELWGQKRDEETHKASRMEKQHRKKRTIPVYHKKHTGNSHCGEEREHGVNEGIHEHPDYVNSGSPYGIEQKNMEGPWLIQGAYPPSAAQVLLSFSPPLLQDQAHSAWAQTTADPSPFKHTWYLSLLHIHLLVTLAPLMKK